MSSYDFVHWSGLPRLSNIEQDVDTLKGQMVTALAGSGSSVYEFTLAGGSSAGDTTITLSRASASFISSNKNLFALIDPGNAKTELRLISSYSGATVTLDTALTYAHAASVQVFLTNADSYATWLWGAKSDSVVDDWASLQRITTETDRYSVWLEGHTFQHQFTQPIVGNNTHMRRITLRCQGSAFSPIDANGAAWLSCQNAPKTFTASASTDTFTTSSAHGANVNQKVVFNVPGGETLPGGITAGQVYWIKTVPTGTTFTISTSLGGATLDVTVDGAGWCYSGVNSLERIFFDDVYFKGGAGNTNLNILRTCLQQPAETRKLRIDGSGGGGGILWYLTGQISNHFNTEINLDPNNIGIQIGDSLVFSEGHNFHGLNMTGGDLAGTVGVKFENCAAIVFTGLWLEHIRQNLLFGTLGAGININTFFLSGGVAGDNAITIPASASHSLKIGRIAPNSYNGTNLISDAQRNYVLTASDGDGNGHIPDFEQPAGNVTPLFGFGKIQSKTAAYTIKLTDSLVKADATGGVFNVTLPDSTHIAGFTVIVKRMNSGANAVTVNTTSAQTIDGAASVSLASQYASVRVQSDGTNWMTI